MMIVHGCLWRRGLGVPGSGILLDSGKVLWIRSILTGSRSYLPKKNGSGSRSKHENYIIHTSKYNHRIYYKVKHFNVLQYIHNEVKYIFKIFWGFTEGVQGLNLPELEETYHRRNGSSVEMKKELTSFCIVPHFCLNAKGSDAFYAKKATNKNVLWTMLFF